MALFLIFFIFLGSWVLSDHHTRYGSIYNQGSPRSKQLGLLPKRGRNALGPETHVQ